MTGGALRTIGMEHTDNAVGSALRQLGGPHKRARTFKPSEIKIWDS